MQQQISQQATVAISDMFNSAVFTPIAVVDEARELRNQWKKKRWGKFTASEFHRLMADGRTKGSIGKSAESYVLEKVAECVAEFQPEDRYISEAMQWGLDHEADAIQAFVERTGIEVSMTGDSQEFFQSECGNYGCTPDGVIVDSLSGIEVKCPNTATHIQYLSIIGAEGLKAVEPKYYWQIQGSMLVTGAAMWHFASFDPRIINPEKRLHTTIIKRVDADIALLKERLHWAILKRDSLIENFA